MIYSILGWCGEMIYCSAGQRKLCEKRGFLNGPICPIYGHGALVFAPAGAGTGAYFSCERKVPKGHLRNYVP